MVNFLKLLEIFYISNMFEVSPRRLRSFWLGLAAAKTPDVQRVRYANADLFAQAQTGPQSTFAQAQTGPQFRSYGYAFGHEPS